MIHSFCSMTSFPKEAEQVLCDAYEKLDKKALTDLMQARHEYISSNDDGYKLTLTAISERLDINIYTLNMLFVIMSMQPMQYMYRAKGYSEKLYIDTVQDTLYKLNECKNLYGVWGCFTLEWYRQFCKCRIFTLGRLQFEISQAPTDYKDSVKKGVKIINVHIPSGAPLTLESVQDSFGKAYRFFGSWGKMIFMCHSWLLYPPMRDLFPEGSNLCKFHDLWDITETEETNEDFWRVFYKEFGTPLSEIVPKTRLEKNLLSYLKSGKSMGMGLGFITYLPDSDLS